MEKDMKIEAHNTSSVTAETVEAKARVQLLLAEIGELRQALIQTRQCIEADDVIGAHGIVCVALAGEQK